MKVEGNHSSAKTFGTSNSDAEASIATLSDLGVLVQDVVRAVVDNSQKVLVTEEVFGRSRMINISVAPNDLGRVIGCRGEVIDAIRTLMDAAHTVKGIRNVTLNLDDRREGARTRSTRSQSVAPLEALEPVRQLLLRLVKAVVDLPDEADIQMTCGTDIVLLEASVARAAIRQIIGRHGKHAEALRVLSRAMAGKLGRHIVFHIIEPAGSEGQGVAA